MATVVSWQADHARLRAAGWRRGRDGLWRHTPEIGGSFLTRNALAIENGTPVAQVVAAGRERRRAWRAGRRLPGIDKSPPV